MKKAFLKWYNYLFALLGDGLVTGVALLIYFLINDESKFPKQYISYTFLFSGVVLIGVGFIIQDLYRGFIRHKLNQWDGPLDEEYINKAWSIFCPMLVAGVLSIIAGGVLVIVFKA